jgi:hypothetical protein
MIVPVGLNPKSLGETARSNSKARTLNERESSTQAKKNQEHDADGNYDQRGKKDSRKSKLEVPQ